MSYFSPPSASSRRPEPLHGSLTGCIPRTKANPGALHLAFPHVFAEVSGSRPHAPAWVLLWFMLLALPCSCLGAEALGPWANLVSAGSLGDGKTSPPFKIERKVVTVTEKSHDYKALAERLFSLFEDFSDTFRQKYTLFRDVHRFDMENYSVRVLLSFFEHYGLSTEPFSIYVEEFVKRKRLRKVFVIREMTAAIKADENVTALLENLDGLPEATFAPDNSSMYEQATLFSLFKEFEDIYSDEARKQVAEARARAAELKEALPESSAGTAAELVDARARIMTLLEGSARFLGIPGSPVWPVRSRFGMDLSDGVSATLEGLARLDDSRLATWIEHHRQLARARGEKAGALEILKKLAGIPDCARAILDGQYMPGLARLRAARDDARGKIAGMKDLSTLRRGSLLAEAAVISSFDDPVFEIEVRKRIENLGQAIGESLKVLDSAVTTLGAGADRYRALAEERIEKAGKTVKALNGLVSERGNLRESFSDRVNDFNDIAEKFRSMLLGSEPMRNLEKAKGLFERALGECRSVKDRFTQNTSQIKALFMNPESVNYLSDLSDYSLFQSLNPVFGRKGWSLGTILSITDDIKVSDVFSPIKFTLEAGDFETTATELFTLWDKLRGINEKVRTRAQEVELSSQRMTAREAVLGNLISTARAAVEAANGMPPQEIDEGERDRIYGTFAKALKAFRRAGVPGGETASSMKDLMDLWEKFSASWAATVQPPSYGPVHFGGVRIGDPIMNPRREVVTLTRHDLVDGYLVLDAEIDHNKFPPTFVKASFDEGRSYSDSTLVRKSSTGDRPRLRKPGASAPTARRSPKDAGSGAGHAAGLADATTGGGKTGTTWWRSRVKPVHGDLFTPMLATADGIGQPRNFPEVPWRFVFRDLTAPNFAKDLIFRIEEDLEDCRRDRILSWFDPLDYKPGYSSLKDRVYEFCDRARNVNLAIDNLSYRFRQDTMELQIRWGLSYGVEPEPFSSALPAKVTRKGITVLFLHRCPNYRIFDMRFLEGVSPFQIQQTR